VTAALVIFALTYLVIAGQKLPFLHLDRPSGALLGAVAMVAAGVLTPASRPWPRSTRTPSCCCWG
jgi:Na+/H+ antiporter NhaD/arsenite permease-like protein